MKKMLKLTLVVVFAGLLNIQSFAHCEVPCGIYTDHLRIELIREHLMTIEKAMKQIDELSAAEEINYNQLVRWIDTKEHHANLIQEIAEQYFMTQRVQPADPEDAEAYGKYITQLTLLHEMLIYAMKTKQSTDVSMVEKLHQVVDKFEKAYFSPEDLEHHHEHEGHSH